MRELVVILEDLFPPLPPTRGAPSRLPALETLLARARREPLTRDWRSWLAARAGVAALEPAALLARAWHIERGAAGCWLATPVHMSAGIDRVLLHPAGLLRLPGSEQQRLAQEFAQVFAGSAWQLHAREERELLLTGPLLAASGRDPARFLGTDPAAGLPTGQEVAPLRTLGSELELWLHEHPLNRERAARGELPVTTLWLWGGMAATSSAAATARSVTRGTDDASLYLYGSDTCAAALVRLLGGQCLPVPADGFTSIAALEATARAVLLYPLRAENGERLERLERQWLAPALAALRAGHLAVLLLVAADRVYHLDRLGRWRVWRARTAWWEVLGGTGSDAP